MRRRFDLLRFMITAIIAYAFVAGIAFTTPGMMLHPFFE